ncbi:CotH kinase family protein [Crocinitomix sp.]|nr:CotH kinase family protein [Crocinitomix sp.]
MRLNLFWFLSLIILLFACKSKKKHSFQIPNAPFDSLIFKSDLENYEVLDGEGYFHTSNRALLLIAGNHNTLEYYRSGNTSYRLDSTMKYGLNFTIKNLTKGHFVELSIWQKIGAKDGSIEVVLKGNEHEIKYRTYYNKNDVGENGWRQHYLNFVIPNNVESLQGLVFSGGETAYFDDFELKIFNQVPANSIPNYLKINLSDTAQSTMRNYIERAGQYEAIPPFVKENVAAQMVIGEDSIPINMKLKGDWKDHLYSGKESYRIKLKGDKTYHGMENFSIQHPKTRHYIDEWIFHKMADQEDILTTSYEFVNIEFNGVNRGVYALEEHFDKRLIERRNRREGPILKFDETSYWSSLRKNLATGKNVERPYFQESPISLFKENRTLKSNQLSESFIEGQKLLQLFKTGALEIDEIFDIDQLAIYYVLMELSGSEHGLRWHNRRFYFNPITQKLEHIVFDINPFQYYPNVICDMANRLNNTKRPLESCFDNCILYSDKFKKRFLFHLNRMTKPAYLDQLFKSIEAELNMYNEALSNEYEQYEFSKTHYYLYAKNLRVWLGKLDALWEEKIKSHPNFNDWVKPQIYQAEGDIKFNHDFSVNGYQTTKNGIYEVQLENFHSSPVTIHAYTTSEQEGVFYLDSAIQLDGFKSKAASGQFNSVLKPKRIYFTIENNPKLILSAKISAWPKPEGLSTRMVLENRFNVHSPHYKIQGNTLIFNKNVVLDKLLLIPAKYEVLIQPGSTIKLEGEGGIIITNSIIALGSESNPIRIISQSSVSNGITILKGNHAVFNHVEFNGLSNLNYGNWQLTGAVTIYETDVKMENCSIIGNHSEDALNVIRSDFSINNLTISDSYSDGFDADFCTGQLSNSNFSDTGNDCIDFSGSTVGIQNINIKNSGDKGISGGEASHLILKNINIKGAITGIASKDASDIKGSNIQIKDVEFGCAAFRKKPEYSGANLTLTSVDIKNAGQELLIGNGSSISLNGQEYLGQEEIDIDSLYARFE